MNGRQKWKWLGLLWIVALCMGGCHCGGELKEKDVSIDPILLSLTPAHQKRYFKATLVALKGKDVEWSFRELVGQLKATLRAQGSSKGESASVSLRVSFEPLPSQDCFLQPKSCKWGIKDTEIKSGASVTLSPQMSTLDNDGGQQKWVMYILAEHKKGPAVQGELSISCKMMLQGASDEELEDTRFHWEVKELIAN